MTDTFNFHLYILSFKLYHTLVVHFFKGNKHFCLYIFLMDVYEDYEEFEYP